MFFNGTNMIGIIVKDTLFVLCNKSFRSEVWEDF
jgi:hypothetical protein